MNKKLLKLFFSSGVQALSVQVLGVAFFVIISLVMPKEEFGIINWANAIAVTLTIVLGLGIEQVVLRRIAASATSDWAAGAFFIHLLATSAITFLLLWLWSGFYQGHEGVQYLPWFFAAQAIIAIASPFKQFLNAKQQFAPYAIIAILANIFKLVLVFWLIHSGILSISNVYIVLIFCASLELIALIIYVRTRNFRFRFRMKAYIKLLKEATPQYIATLFDSSLSRTDWILLGIMASNVVTAEYSFAYRAYEIARLPQAILNPIMLGIFAKMLMAGRSITQERQKDINDLFSVEMFFAMLLPLYLNILWNPVLDYFFDGKYGTVNHTQFLILSICIPFQFFINVLWGLSFSAKYYKPVSLIIGITSVLNIVLNIFLIQWLSAEGAAIAYLVTTVLQLLGYYRLVKSRIMSVAYISFAGLLVAAGLAYYITFAWLDGVVIQILAATGIYCILAFGTRVIKVSSIKKTVQLLMK